MPKPRFAPYAWGVVLFTLVVIVWGAFVRASGSGAGCGSHWPLCNGVVLPREPALNTVIEFAHRTTSGLAFLAVLGLVYLARRDFPAGHLVRRGAWVTLFFMVTEALVGAGLVLLGLVENNDSVTRAVYLGVHLINTFLLLAAMTLTAWWGSGHATPGRTDARRVVPYALALAALLLVGVSGAVTALGDTLFPAGSLPEGFRQDTSPTAHFLLRLRVLHPLLAVATGMGLLLLAVRGAARGASPVTLQAGRAVATLVTLQLLAGVVNLFLLAPVWMQLVHLLLADLVWLSTVILAASAAADQAPDVAPSPILDPAVARR